jgi:hypothetical protein
MIAQPIANVAVGTGVQAVVDVDTRRLGTLTVAWKLLATVTTGDLTLNDAIPYDATGTLMTVPLGAIASSAPASDGTNVVAIKTFNVSGIEKMRLRAQNNNAGTKNLTVDIFGEYAGRS